MKYFIWFCKAMALCILIFCVVWIIDMTRTFEEPKEPIYEHYYPEVVYMLHSDSIMAIHRFWGVDTITCYDWEESANALGCPPEIMTIDMYMDYFQCGHNSKYVRNRACQSYE